MEDNDCYLSINVDANEQRFMNHFYFHSYIQLNDKYRFQNDPTDLLQSAHRHHLSTEKASMVILADIIGVGWGSGGGGSRCSDVARLSCIKL